MVKETETDNQFLYIISSINDLNKTKMDIIASLCTELLIEMTAPPFALDPPFLPPRLCSVYPECPAWTSGTGPAHYRRWWRPTSSTSGRAALTPAPWNWTGWENRTVWCSPDLQIQRRCVIDIYSFCWQYRDGTKWWLMINWPKNTGTLSNEYYRTLHVAKSY